MFTIGSEGADQARRKSEKEEEKLFHGRVYIEVVSANR